MVRVLASGERLSGIIVETEAYLGEIDRGSHTYGGRRTERTEPMYAIGGTSYVYFTYGMHFCMNVAAGRRGQSQAVLIRALAPEEGIERMMALRAGDSGRTVSERDLCRGPARLCQAMAIGRAETGLDTVTSNAIFFEQGVACLDAAMIGNSARIGLKSAGEWTDRPLRWFIVGSPHVSGPRRVTAGASQGRAERTKISPPARKQ